MGYSFADFLKRKSVGMEIYTQSGENGKHGVGRRLPETCLSHTARILFCLPVAIFR